MDQLKTCKTYKIYPSVIGAKGFHYPDLDRGSELLCMDDTAIEFLPFVYLPDRKLVAYKVSAQMAGFLKLTNPVIWIAE